MSLSRMRHRARSLPPLLFLLGLTSAVAVVVPGWAATAPKTTRVSVSSSGAEAEGESGGGGISANGRFVAFQSAASNLVQGDRNDLRDVFVRDRRTGRTTRVSVSSAGTEANTNGFVGQGSLGGSISANGRFVAFISDASNLVRGDHNFGFDVFVRDRLRDRTTRVSVSSGGAEAVRASFGPSISADGRFVAFESSAGNLVAGDRHGKNDIFVRDRWSKKTTRVSVSSSGAEGNRYSESPSISADGRYVAFASDASNLVPGDRNDQRDVFVRDRRRRKTTRVSVGSPAVKADGFSYSPSISADGRFVAFGSKASNLVRGDRNLYDDVFVRDRKAGKTTLVSVSSAGAGGIGSSSGPSISSDGRLVVFGSLAPNLVDGDSNDHGDVFVRDRRTDKTTRVSVSSAGEQADGESGGGGISADGRFVAFGSYASNLVEGDRRGLLDVFVRGPLR